MSWELHNIIIHMYCTCTTYVCTMYIWAKSCRTGKKCSKLNKMSQLQPHSKSRPGWSGKFVLLDSWKTMLCKYRAEYSRCWDHFKVPNRIIDVLRKNCLRLFNFTLVKLLHLPQPLWVCPTSYIQRVLRVLRVVGIPTTQPK